jgi:hypothetical protein
VTLHNWTAHPRDVPYVGAVVCSAAKHCLKTLYEWVEAAWQIREEESRRRCKLAGAAVAQGQAGAVAWEECKYGDYCWQPVCRVLGDVDVMDGYCGKGACLTVWDREQHTRHAIPCQCAMSLATQDDSIFTG